MWLFVAFLTVPLLEIALFIQVGGWIGLWPTLAIVIATAALGTWLVRDQGRMAMGDLRGSFERLEDPSEPLAHGAMILVSGALLLTPGFFTDAVGFALLSPAVRRAVFLWVRKRVAMQRFSMGSQAAGGGDGPGGPRPPRSPGPVIDADFRDVTDAPPQHGPAEANAAEHDQTERADTGARDARRGTSGWTRH